MDYPKFLIISAGTVAITQPILLVQIIGFFVKAKVESLRAQILFIQVWDYDPGFPGIQNDDYLGR